jgi:ferredoxin
MTYVINEACIGEKDLSCVDVCPVDCIHEVDEMLVIDPGECIDCAACEPVCPVKAITPAEGVPAGQNEFIAINAAWADGPESVSRLLAEFRAGKSPR